jgi:hypothetical protein
MRVRALQISCILRAQREQMAVQPAVGNDLSTAEPSDPPLDWQSVDVSFTRLVILVRIEHAWNVRAGPGPALGALTTFKSVLEDLALPVSTRNSVAYNRVLKRYDWSASNIDTCFKRRGYIPAGVGERLERAKQHMNTIATAMRRVTAERVVATTVAPEKNVALEQWVELRVLVGVAHGWLVNDGWKGALVPIDCIIKMVDGMELIVRAQNAKSFAEFVEFVKLDHWAIRQCFRLCKSSPSDLYARQIDAINAFSNINKALGIDERTFPNM